MAQTVTRLDLEEYFEECGDIVCVQLDLDKMGIPVGSGLVLFTESASMEEALSLSGASLKGSRIDVSPWTGMEPSEYAATGAPVPPPPPPLPPPLPPPPSGPAKAASSAVPPKLGGVMARKRDMQPAIMGSQLPKEQPPQYRSLSAGSKSSSSSVAATATTHIDDAGASRKPFGSKRQIPEDKDDDDDSSSSSEEDETSLAQRQAAKQKKPQSSKPSSKPSPKKDKPPKERGVASSSGGAASNQPDASNLSASQKQEIFDKLASMLQDSKKWAEGEGKTKDVHGWIVDVQRRQPMSAEAILKATAAGKSTHRNSADWYVYAATQEHKGSRPSQTATIRSYKAMREHFDYDEQTGANGGVALFKPKAPPPATKPYGSERQPYGFERPPPPPKPSPVKAKPPLSNVIKIASSSEEDSDDEA